MRDNNIAGSIDKLVFYLFCMILMIDMINGYFLVKGIHLPISQIYKFGILFLIFLRLSFYKKFPSIVLPYLLFFIWIFIYFLISSFWSEKVIMYSKFLMTVITSVYFERQFQANPEQTKQKVNKIFIINLWVLIFNIFVLGIMGIGFVKYGNRGEGIGSKGFFFSGNEISVVFILLFSYMIYTLFYNKQKYRLFIMIFLLVVAVYSSTKVAIMGSLLMSVMLPFLAHRTKQGIFRKILYVMIVLFIGSLLLLVLYNMVEKSGLLERWIYFYEKDVSYFLLSGRDYFVDVHMHVFSFAPDTQQLFGLFDIRITEMDFIDILLNYGYCGLLIIYSYYLFVCYRINHLRKKGNYPYAQYSLLVVVLILSISFVAGHTIFSGLAGGFTGITMAMAFYKHPKKWMPNIQI